MSMLLLSACAEKPGVTGGDPNVEQIISSFDECVAAGNPVMESYPRQCKTLRGEIFVEQLGKEEVPQAIGGQRDKYGCLGPAGYMYDEEIAACIRTWELTGPMREASRIAVAHEGARRGLTIVEVRPMRCVGCFEVDLTDGEERVTVSLRDWNVME